MSCGSSSLIFSCHAAPVRHSGCQHCGSQHCGAASCHAAPLLGRVKTKIFVFVFPGKFLLASRTQIYLQKLLRKQKFSRKRKFSHAKLKIFAKSDYGYATLLSVIVILCNFNMLMKRVSIGLKRKPLFSSENKRKLPDGFREKFHKKF
jgi:hypothetical protein